MGRPSKYTDDLPEKMIAFFNIDEPFEKIIIKQIDKVSAQGAKTTQVDYKLVPKKLPTFERFAHDIGVDYDTLRRWATQLVNPDAEPDAEDYGAFKHPEFCGAYNACKFLQKEFLIQNGLAGMYPPSSYIFTAKNITDMTDRTIVETDDSDAKSLKEKRDVLDGWLDSIQHHVTVRPDSLNPNP